MLEQILYTLPDLQEKIQEIRKFKIERTLERYGINIEKENANDIINNIFEELADDSETKADLIQRTRDALEDGEVLGAMNISQEESEAAEAALDELAEKPETTKLFVFEGNSLDLMDKDEFMSNFGLDGDYDSWVGQGGNLDDVMDFSTKEQALTYLDDALETGRIDKEDYRALRVQALLA